MPCQHCGTTDSHSATPDAPLCVYCESRQLLTGHGMGLDEVVLLGGTCDLDCPACGDLLVTAILDQHTVRACPNCFGVSIPQGTFSQLIAQRREQLSSQPTPPPARLGTAHLAHSRDCPICREPMAVHPNLGPGATLIDTCSRCRQVWFDAAASSALHRAPGNC